MAADERPEPRDGNIYKRVAGPRTGAGYVTLSLGPVHLHECPYWRMGQKHAPCRCGSRDLMDRLVTEHGTFKPCEACGVDVAYLDLGVFGLVPQTHRSPQGYQCRGPVEELALATPDIEGEGS